MSPHRIGNCVSDLEISGNTKKRKLDIAHHRRNIVNILPDDEYLLRHTIYGLVGNRAGVEFMAFHKTTESLDVKAMMLGEKEVVIPEKADLRYALCSGVAYYLWRGVTEKEKQALLDGFFTISLRLSSDFAALLMMDAMKGGESCKGADKLYAHPKFKEWEKKHGETFRKAGKR